MNLSNRHRKLAVGATVSLGVVVMASLSLFHSRTPADQFKQLFDAELPSGATNITIKRADVGVQITFYLSREKLKTYVSQPIAGYEGWHRQTGMISLLDEDIIEDRDLRIDERTTRDGFETRQIVVDMDTARVVAFYACTD